MRGYWTNKYRTAYLGNTSHDIDNRLDCKPRSASRNAFVYVKEEWFAEVIFYPIPS